jgi:hypothetical protein
VSIRLFHKGARIVWPRRPAPGVQVWYVVHTRFVGWEEIFAPALRLIGYQPATVPGGLRFDAGTIHWRRGALGTTIRLALPGCSERKAALLAAGLLKAARYAPVPGASDAA